MGRVGDGEWGVVMGGKKDGRKVGRGGDRVVR